MAEKEKKCKFGGYNTKLCNETTCDVCREKSFVSHPKSIYWHHENKLSPRNVFKTTETKFKFRCGKCNHDFFTSPGSIVKNRWCPYCSNQKLCDSTKCKICYEKTVAAVSHKLINDRWLTKENGAPPSRFFAGNSKKFWFHCEVCDHTFDSTIQNMESSKHKCIYCAGQKLCGDKSCKVCFNNSFAAYKDTNSDKNTDFVKCWSSDNGNVKPHMVMMHSNKLYLFICDKCNYEFTSSPNRITGVNKSWCPQCAGVKMCNKSKCKKSF